MQVHYSEKGKVQCVRNGKSEVEVMTTYEEYRKDKFTRSKE